VGRSTREENVAGAWRQGWQPRKARACEATRAVACQPLKRFLYADTTHSTRPAIFDHRFEDTFSLPICSITPCTLTISPIHPNYYWTTAPRSSTYFGR
jgi:hypothetical protein